MNVRQLRFGSWIAAGMLALAAAAAAAAALLLPYDAVPAPGKLPPSVVAPPPARPVERVTIEDFEPFLAGSLRIAAAPSPEPMREFIAEVAPPPSSPPPPILQAQLLGTVTETANNYAVFQNPDGTIEMKRIGDSIDGAKIIEITEGVATVRSTNGQNVTLQVPLPPS